MIICGIIWILTCFIRNNKIKSNLTEVIGKNNNLYWGE